MILGAQLYTLRLYTQNEKDLDYSLGEVAKMGYTTVQISAVSPAIPPKTVRALCDKHGLSIVLTHTDPNRILNDTEGVIRDHEIMGCKYIGIGMMPERYRTPEWLSHFAEDYMEPARKIKEAGMLLMYHNHNMEFQKLDNKLYMDHLAEAFAPDEMGFTLDTYWMQAGGVDVCQYIEKYKDRIPCVHLKDMEILKGQQTMAPVLEGNMNFKAILRTLEGTNCEYILVEQDICQESPFVCLKKSYDNVAALGYK